MEWAVPLFARKLLASLAVLWLAAAAGLAVFALRPVFASASPSLMSVSPSIVPEPSVAAGSATSGVLAAPSAPARVLRRAAVVSPGKERKAPGTLTARVRAGSVTLYAKPGRGRLASLGAVNEFGSPRTLSVVAQKGRWLGIVAPELGNGTIGWVDAQDASLVLGRTRISVTIDLSRRLAVVKRGHILVRRFTVGVGMPGSPTPTGRFAVTDKLAGDRYGSVYGCCIVALSAHQPNLPPGWRGGNRVAIHGTNDPSSIGAASSAGCPHASEADMRFLMRTLPLGTPVTIHP